MMWRRQGGGGGVVEAIRRKGCRYCRDEVTPKSSVFNGQPESKQKAIGLDTSIPVYELSVVVFECVARRM